MKASSVIKLNQTALQSNWDFLRSYFKGKQISAVVKGNAYGHGITTYVPMAEACGVNHFSVFNAGEAYEVYKVASPDSTIMIMGSLDNDDIEWAIQNNIEFYVFTMERLATAIHTAEKLDKKAIIHIEIETGMYRTGFEHEEIPELIAHLKNNSEKLVFKGLCMHFAGAESIANYVRIKKQKIIFKKALKTFKEAGILPEIVHTCCSAAAVRLPDMHYDMLRIGIMQYGFWSGPEVLIEYLNKHKAEQSPLKRIISWESSIMSLKEVPPGEYIGYGATFFSQQTMHLGIVPVGYAHGFSRSLSNTGIVLINGKRAPVVGMVNMNCIAIDVTHIPNVKPKDTVLLIGTQGEHEVSVASFGEMSNQLNYELLTRLPLDIERKRI
ncbi:alanine racemase [Flavobacterium salilacus subsp. salilacus]|uniref:alanine racemase n=1 Tax=Flavobacterium TaxID=237 RepID=UPI001074A978|nr:MULTISPECIES: alanine racemase [Flavobacterium]KAF2519694.1 alanine racemase [Flavobacterium salilacus subsp. salilacus]MBE1614418.1 alanine racemase [Flavobacterium sp. SaA2.13]